MSIFWVVALYLIMWLFVSHRNPRIVARVLGGGWSGAVSVCQSSSTARWFTSRQSRKPDIPPPAPWCCQRTQCIAQQLWTLQVKHSCLSFINYLLFCMAWNSVSYRKEEHKLRVFQSKLPRRIFGPKRVKRQDAGENYMPVALTKVVTGPYFVRFPCMGLLEKHGVWIQSEQKGGAASLNFWCWKMHEWPWCPSYGLDHPEYQMSISL